MVATTVGLDNQPGVAPEEIRHQLATLDPYLYVDLWLGQRRSLAHAKELPLHLTSSPLGVRADFVQQHAEPGNPTTAPAATDHPSHGVLVENPQNLCLGDCLSQLPDWRDSGEVEQCPRDGGAWNPMKNGSIGRGQRSGPMSGDCLRDPSSSIWRCYIDLVTGILAQAPQCGG